MKKKIEFLIPAVFTAYIFVSLLMLSFLGARLPALITNIFSISYLIFFPLGPIFRPLGLWEGEMWSGPTIPGIVFGVLIYDLILFLILKGLASFHQRGC